MPQSWGFFSVCGSLLTVHGWPIWTTRPIVIGHYWIQIFCWTICFNMCSQQIIFERAVELYCTPHTLWLNNMRSSTLWLIMPLANNSPVTPCERVISIHREALHSRWRVGHKVKRVLKLSQCWGLTCKCISYIAVSVYYKYTDALPSFLSTTHPQSLSFHSHQANLLQVYHFEASSLTVSWQHPFQENSWIFQLYSHASQPWR